MLGRFWIVVVFVFASACVQLTTESLPSRAVDETFDRYRFAWRSGDEMSLGMKTFEQRGKVGICGAYAELNINSPYTDQLNSQALAAAQVRLAGETLVRGLNFFGRGSFVKGSLPSAQASCVLTDRPWEKRFERTKPRIRWGKTSFRVVD